MTVPAGTSIRDRYIATGSQDTFQYNFKIFEDDDISVYLQTTITGTAELQTLNVDYTVTGAGNETGGNVVFTSNPAADTIVILKGTYDYEQETDYVENDSFPAQVHENALDKLTLLQIVDQDAISRSIVASEADPTDIDLTLPYYTQRQSKFLAFDSTGKEIIMSNGTAQITTDYTTLMLQVVDEAALKAYINAEAGVDFMGHSAYLDNLDTDEAGIRSYLEVPHLNSDNVWTQQQIYNDGSLSYSDTTNVYWDLANDQHAFLTVTGTTTINVQNVPTNTGYFTLMIQQDATGGHVVSFDSNFYWPDATSPSITTTASGVDIIGAYSKSGQLFATAAQDFGQ